MTYKERAIEALEKRRNETPKDLASHAMTVALDILRALPDDSVTESAQKANEQKKRGRDFLLALDTSRSDMVSHALDVAQKQSQTREPVTEPAQGEREPVECPTNHELPIWFVNKRESEYVYSSDYRRATRCPDCGARLSKGDE